MKTTKVALPNTNELFELIRVWAKEKGIFDNSNPEKQFLKLIEEVGELSEAMQKKDYPAIQDGIGDAVVVLTLLAEMHGLYIEDSLDSVYNIISKRTGKIENGVFKKDS